MALVNPNIAMSFRQPEFRPRNALAEYAQIQQIMGGQRQAEMADMQMEELRRERDALGRIQAAIVAKGGPPDLGAAAEEMIRTGRPQFITQGQAILTALRNQREAEAYRKDFGGRAAAPNAAAEAAGVAAPGVTPTFPIAGKDVRMGTLGTGTFDSARSDDIGLVQPGLSRMSAADRAEMAASAGPGGIQSMRMSQGPYMGTESMIADILRAPPEEQAAIERALPSMKIPGVSAGRVPPFSQLSRDLLSPETRNALSYGYAPASLAVPVAPSTNAMLAPAAQPAMPPAGVNQLASAGAAAPDANAARLAALEAQYRRIGNNPELASEKALLLKQIEVALQAQSKTTTPKIDVIGVAANTNEPVYFDAVAGQQFKISTDPSGRQVRVPYAGGVNRATSSVTATATSTGGRLEGAEQKGQGELNIKSFAEIRDAARLAARTLPALETQAKILDQGFTTGFGTEVKKAGASFLAALGVPEAEKFATDAQTFLSATQQAVLQKQLEQKGTQTKADADRIEKTGAQFGNTVKGNRFIIDVAREQLRRDIEQRDFYSNWWNNKKTYEGAEDAWYASEGGKSLFDRPALKKYAAPAQGAAAVGAAPAIPQAAINDLKAGRGTDAQFDAIFGAGAAKRVREGK